MISSSQNRLTKFKFQIAHFLCQLTKSNDYSNPKAISVQFETKHFLFNVFISEVNSICIESHMEAAGIESP